MSVYVDRAENAYGRMLMCHMVADTTEELLAMADRIAVARRWLQHAGRPDEHFDICKSKRAEAVKHGAIDADRKTFVNLIRRKRGVELMP